MHACKYPSAYIVNTASKRSTGEHWLALYFSSRNHSCVFDSYGRSFSNLPSSIQGFISRNSLACSFNTRILQQLHSQTCGLYSILFLFYMSRLYVLGDCLSIFTTDPRENDFLVYHCLYSIFNKWKTTTKFLTFLIYKTNTIKQSIQISLFVLTDEEDNPFLYHPIRVPFC